MSASDTDKIPQHIFHLNEIKVKVVTDNADSPENTYAGTPYEVGRQIRHTLGHTNHSKMELELLEPKELKPLSEKDIQELTKHEDLAFLAVNLRLTTYSRILQAAKNLGLLRQD